MADNSSQDFHRASRKAEESAARRYEAVHWLNCVIGPIGSVNGIPKEPTERDFISCLRNGFLLCYLINKLLPGTIPKVVESHHVPVDSKSLIWDSTPLPAYQYFENVRNFLVALQHLNLPTFHASDLDTENIEPGSAARIADSILALKSYHEWQERTGGNGVYKHVTNKSPLILHSATTNFSRPLNKETCRQLDMSAMHNRNALEESIVKVLSEHLVDSKENMNTNFQPSLQKGKQDPVQIFSETLSRCLVDKLRLKFPELNLQETSGKARASHTQMTSILEDNSPMKTNSKIQHLKSHSRKGSSSLKRMLRSQEKDLTDIRALWSDTKREFEDLRKQLTNDLNYLGSLIEEMSSPSRGYQRVIQENRKLYSMLQDLKGNIRVHCRIRPLLNTEAKGVISFHGEDATLVVLDPSKPPTEGRRSYQFNRVYGPMATQDELFKDTRPLIRSVMDGYNVCIFAYGQTGSGKTHTMYGSSGASENEMGINFFALDDLFKTVNIRKGTITYELHLQMVEIWNEQIRDLLAEVPVCQNQPSVSNGTSHAVKSTIEAINLVKEAHVRRTGDSSRKMTALQNCSHSVVTIHVHGKDLSGNIIRSRLYLVDLAGSEEGDMSLSCLEDAITSLSHKHSCVHYRDSKLTTLLEDALGGNAKILVLAHVIPVGDNFTETDKTLKFAQRISTVELGAVQSNKMNNEVMELKNEMESLKSALGDKAVRSPHPAKQLKSPCDKARIVPKRTPVKSRRLSMEIQEKLPKSPVGRPKITTETTPPRSLRKSVENPSAIKTDMIRNPKTGKQSERSCPRSRRLSIENPVIATSEITLKMKEPKSPCEGGKGVAKLTPPRTRRLSIENSSSVRPVIDNKGTKAPQTSLRVRRLSLEGPKDRTKENMGTKTPSTSCLHQPTFTDCAQIYPPLQPLKTPEQQNHSRQHVIHAGIHILTDFQTPGTAKGTNGKGSQIKKSLRTIGKLINGSDKRNQHKLESTSTKVIGLANGAKSPPSSKARVVRRQSLTNIPPSGTTRRTSLGGTWDDSLPNGNRNEITPPSVRSSVNTVKRWM